VPVGRLAGLAFASSLAQAGVAVALVYGLVAALGLGRGAVEGAAERWVTPVGHALIAGLGLWLVWRGVAGLRRAAAKAARDHDHDPHDHHDHGPQCNHAHGPTLEDARRVSGWRDGAALVAGIAMRPCSGALFVLVLTWQFGIPLAGIVGAFAMGLGTAVVTVATALMAVWAREGFLAGIGESRVLRVLPLVELVLGAVIFTVALGLFAQAI
jgi:nickel/cobalt transporter (NicO) family protein